MKPRQSAHPQLAPLEEQLVGVNAKTGIFPGARMRSWSGGRLRVLGKGPLESYCYHVMSRTNGGEIRFDEVEKEALRRVIWRMAEFCGVKVVTYCIMGNHFHLLAEVPHRETWLQRFEGPEGEARLFEHLRVLYSKAYLGLLCEDLKDLRERGLTALAQERVDALKKRFCDLSLFVKEVKERFSRWYNKRHGRRGTLWMDRFKSVLVEGKGAARSVQGPGKTGGWLEDGARGRGLPLPAARGGTRDARCAKRKGGAPWRERGQGADCFGGVRQAGSGGSGETAGALLHRWGDSGQQGVCGWHLRGAAGAIQPEAEDRGQTHLAMRGAAVCVASATSAGGRVSIEAPICPLKTGHARRHFTAPAIFAFIA